MVTAHNTFGHQTFYTSSKAVLTWCHVSGCSFPGYPAPCLEKKKKNGQRSHKCMHTHTNTVTPCFIPEAGSSSEVSLAFTVKAPTANTPDQSPAAWLVQVNTTRLYQAQVESWSQSSAFTSSLQTEAHRDLQSFSERCRLWGGGHVSQTRSTDAGTDGKLYHT